LAIDFADPGSPPAITPAIRVANRVEVTGASGAGAYPVTGEGPFLRSTIQTSINKLRQLRGNHAAFNRNGTAFPTVAGDPNVASLAATSSYYNFFARMEEAVYMLNQGISNFAGVELGGWDTHNEQTTAGQVGGSSAQGIHQILLAMLSHAITSAKASLGADSMILVVSEFGRTNRDNGSGTDHGVGALYMAIGDQVNGGVYNCWLPASQTMPAMGQPKGSQWRRLLAPPTDPKYFDAIEPATDFRVPLIEIATKFFQIPSANLVNLSEVGPAWRDIYNNTMMNPAYAQLNFV
ncbi:MAG TPA: DUF1501 domain-containing protein, partial [Planctomycetota bacterium]|nr:DUF1501 domain-containing protein [Planctomycetota bacterium]